MKRVFLLTLIFASILIGYAQEKKRQIIRYSGTNIVYVIPGTTTYHTPNCKLLGTAKTAMTLNYAKEKNYRPCEECFFEEVDILPDQSGPEKSKIPKLNVEPSGSISRSSILTGGFRGVPWGDPIEKVQKIEKSQFIKKDIIKERGLETLVYSGNISGHECIIGYFFASKQLVGGRYVLLIKHSNDNLYIDDFKEIKTSLIEKYGKPLVDRIDWSDELYRDDPDDWGMAISIGHLSYIAIWAAKDADIQLLLHGDNYTVTLLIDYTSSAHEELIKKVESEAKKSIW